MGMQDTVDASLGKVVGPVGLPVDFEATCNGLGNPHAIRLGRWLARPSPPPQSWSIPFPVTACVGNICYAVAVVFLLRGCEYGCGVQGWGLLSVQCAVCWMAFLWKNMGW